MALKDILTWVLPPMRGASEDEIYAWHIRIAVTQLLEVGAMILIVVWILGLTPIFSGYAGLDDVRELKRAQSEIAQSVVRGNNEIKALYLGGVISDIRVRQCTALKMGNMIGAQALRVALDEKLIDYQRVTGTNYPLRGCDEF
jgi:hypothetical protein